MTDTARPQTPPSDCSVERRSPARAERRRGRRGGRRVGDLARASALSVLCLALSSVKAAAAEPVRFGFDVASVSAARGKGMPLTFGSLWAGAWNQKHGWGGIQDQLSAAKANGVIPVIQWWYWGDDISPACVENGCWDGRQGVQKDKATWYRMSNELADLVVRVMGPGSPAIIVVEGEFNRAGIENYEPFDGYLADHARIFHDRKLTVVLEFGNWGQSLWPNFDRAIAASDLLGAMVLQSSIHEASTYMSGADMLLSTARYYQTKFGKPCFVTDFAFSSYPETAYSALQDRVVRDIFNRMHEFRAAGVRGMVWRMLSDDPTFDTSNYHAIAERHWGLLRADGSEKPAFASFLNGMLAEERSTALPNPPANLSAAVGDGQATLTWTAASGALGYNVQHSTTNGGPFQTIAIGVAGTSFVHTGLVNTVTYYYVVSSEGSAGDSGPSGQVSVTPVAGVAPGRVDVWWPTAGATVGGVQPFKALLEGRALAEYRMYWRVDGGQWNLMSNSLVDYPHKEAPVDVSTWKWRGRGPYTVEFGAQSLAGNTLALTQVNISVQ